MIYVTKITREKHPKKIIENELMAYFKKNDDDVNDDVQTIDQLTQIDIGEKFPKFSF